MARVTTQIITAATAGDGVDSLQVTKVSLNGASRAVSVTALITAVPDIRGAKGYLYMVSSPVDVATSAAVKTLARQAYMKEFSWPLDGGHLVQVQTPPRIIQGAFLYVWFELPTVDSPGTLDAWAVEV